MLDRTFIVPRPDLPSKHALENLLPNLKAATVQTLDTILSLEGTPANGLQAFVDAISELRDIKPIEEELIYECFLKLSDFEAYWCSILREYGFLEKHAFLGKGCGRNSAPAPVDIQGSDGNVVTRMAADRVNCQDDSAGSRTRILAYTIMAAYTGQFLEYEGPAETFYLINYVLKTARQVSIHEEVVRWGMHAATANNRLFYIEGATFFMNELRYARDRSLVERVVLTRRSHHLLYLKIGLFCHREQDGRERAASVPAVNNEERARLKGMLVGGFERAMARYSELILEYLQDEELTKYFIKETRCPVLSFYKTCHTVDCGYAEALVHNLAHFSHIIDSDLGALAASPFLRFVTRGMKGFKTIAGELIRRNMPFNANDLFLKTPPKPAKEMQGLEVSRNLSQASLRDDQWTDLRKIEYLVDNGIAVSSRRFIASLDENDKSTVLKIFFKLERPKLIPSVYRLAEAELFEELRGMTAYSLFYARCLNYLAKNGVDVSSMHIKDDLTAYGSALKRRIKGCGGNSAFATHSATPCSLGASSAAIAGAGGSDPAVGPSPCNIRGSLEVVLFFRNSNLLIKNGNSRFTLSGSFTAEHSHSLRENVFLKLDTQIRLYTKKNAVYAQQSGAAPEKVLSLRSRSREEDSLANEGSCVSGGMPEEYHCFGLKCIYNKKKLSIIINGQEHRCYVKNLDWIGIDCEFSGMVTNLVYYQSNAEFHVRECRDDLEYYRTIVAPLQRLLKYRQRAGILLNGPRPFILNGALEIRTKNILDYKTPREAEDAA